MECCTEQPSRGRMASRPDTNRIAYGSDSNDHEASSRTGVCAAGASGRRHGDRNRIRPLLSAPRDSLVVSGTHTHYRLAGYLARTTRSPSIVPPTIVLPGHRRRVASCLLARICGQRNRPHDARTLAALRRGGRRGHIASLGSRSRAHCLANHSARRTQ